MQGKFIPPVVVWSGSTTIGGFVPSKLVFRNRMLERRGMMAGVQGRWRVVRELSIGGSRRIAGRWRHDQAKKFTPCDLAVPQRGGMSGELVARRSWPHGSEAGRDARHFCE